MALTALLGLDPAPPLSDLEYQEIYKKFVVEGMVVDLTWDVIAWVNSPAPTWVLTRLRYEYEKIIPGAHGNDMFLELTYAPVHRDTEFPHPMFYFYPVIQWHIHFIDFVDITPASGSVYTKVIIRMAKKEDLCESHDES